MTIALVNVGTVEHLNNVSVSPGLYTGNSVDDLILNFDAFREPADGTTVTCAGYTSLAVAASTGSRRLSVFAKVHDGSEANPTNSGDGATNVSHSAATIGITGTLNDLSGGTPEILDGTPQTIVGGATDLTIEYPALTVTNDNCIVFLAIYNRDDLGGFTFNTPAGFTKALEADTTLGADHAFAVYYQIQTTATNISSGTVTKSGGTTATNLALIFALQPTVVSSLAPIRLVWRTANG